MFCITIKFKNEPSAWTLVYHSDEAMRQAWKQASTETDAGMHYVLADEFGQECSVPVTCVAGVILEDLDKSILAHVERGLHNAHIQATADKTALNDPTLKEHRRTRTQSPGIFNPMGNGMHR